MGSKWHWTLSPARRRLLLRVEKDSVKHREALKRGEEYDGWRPKKFSAEADRYWALHELGFMSFDIDGLVTVHPKGRK